MKIEILVQRAKETFRRDKKVKLGQNLRFGGQGYDETSRGRESHSYSYPEKTAPRILGGEQRNPKRGGRARFASYVSLGGGGAVREEGIAFYNPRPLESRC